MGATVSVGGHSSRVVKRTRGRKGDSAREHDRSNDSPSGKYDRSSGRIRPEVPGGFAALIRVMLSRVLRGMAKL
jgi:hypothetical protein